MFKTTGIMAVVALLFLAGCATAPPTTPPAAEEPISPPVPTNRSSALDWIDPDAVHPPVAPRPAKPLTPPPMVEINHPPVVIPTPAPVLTWTSLGRWTAEHKLNPPQLVSKTPVTTYSVSSTNGVMLLGIGLHEATWNGIDIELGFEPQIIDGQVFLHGLDLQKNLQPLLFAPQLAFGTSHVIVIDPGHGGINSGTKSVLDGRFEKEFTLDWAKRLVPLLEANGWQVFLTRTYDTDCSLSNRVAFAEAHHADVFISLHFNSAAPDTKQAGLETYCLTPTGMPSTLTRGFADPWSENLPNNAFDAQNLQLAMRLHAALLHATGEEDRGVRHARFLGVLRGEKRPAILIEGGYLSNPREAKRIEDPEFRQKLAVAVADALRLPPEIKNLKPENPVPMADTNKLSTP